MSFGFITEDGWPSCTADELDFSDIPGTTENVGLQRGQPNTILKAFMAELNRSVESMANGRGSQDEGGWTGTNSVPTSNHLGGTAFDYNWEDHPMGPKVPDPAAGWQGSAITGWLPEEPFVRKLLEYFTYKGLQLVWWANDWNSPHDSMHFQMGYGTHGDDRVQQFIDECIDPATGFSRFAEHGGVSPGDAGDTLAQAMLGHPGVNYQDMAPLFAQFCAEAGCTTTLRIAMAAAQLGEESGGLYWMEEIASGAEYEGNAQLGNTFPGDGPRFKGRGPIQLTGRNNYGKFSQWAYANHSDMCPNERYFVDHPELVSEFDVGFLAAAYYWVSHNLNSFADNGDVVGATKVINGGDHGLQDRQHRYQTCIQMGDRLLELLGQDDWMTNPDVVKMITEIHRETVEQKSPSRSFMAEDGNPIDTPLGIAWNTDANAWTLVMTEAYRLNVPLAVKTVEDIAQNGVAQTSWAGANGFNKWLQDFGQAYCKGLVYEKHVTPKTAPKAVKAVKK